jgi:hypothetical protein
VSWLGAGGNRTLTGVRSRPVAAHQASPFKGQNLHGFWPSFRSPNPRSYQVFMIPLVSLLES